MYQTITEQYTFPEFIFRNHMSHENEAILRKSIYNERNTRDILEVLVNNIEENIDINIKKNKKIE